MRLTACLLLLAAALASLLARLVRHQFRLDRLAGQIDVAHVNLVVDRVRRGVAAIGVVDDEQAAAGVRQQHGPLIEQAVGVMHLDRLAPVVAVEPAGEGQPVRAGVGAVAGAELLRDRSARTRPLPSSADLRIGVARWPSRTCAGLRARRRSRRLPTCEVGSSATGFISLPSCRGRRRGPSGRCRADCRRRTRAP